MVFAAADHRVLIPASMMTGAAVMLLCDIVSKMMTLPINTVTALVGIPIVVFVVIRNRSIV
jgi:iron complex transport system permease protein